MALPRSFSSSRDGIKSLSNLPATVIVSPEALPRSTLPLKIAVLLKVDTPTTDKPAPT